MLFIYISRVWDFPETRIDSFKREPYCNFICKKPLPRISTSKSRSDRQEQYNLNQVVSIQKSLKTSYNA